MDITDDCASPLWPSGPPTIDPNSQSSNPLKRSLSFSSSSSSSNELPPSSKRVCHFRFSIFNSLPPELRLHVWEIAAKDTHQTIHVIENRRYKFHTGHLGKFWIDPKNRVKTDAKVPVLFQVNYESREVAKKYWKLQFIGMNAISPIYFNFERDTLFAHSLAVLNTLFGPGLMGDDPDYQYLNDPYREQRTVDHRNRASNEEEKKMRGMIKHLVISGQLIADGYEACGEKFTDLENLKIMDHASNRSLLEADKLALIHQRLAEKRATGWKAPTISLITPEEQMEIDLFFVEGFDKGHAYRTLASEEFPNLNGCFEEYPSSDECFEDFSWKHRMKKGNELSIELARRTKAAAARINETVDVE